MEAFAESIIDNELFQTVLEISSEAVWTLDVSKGQTDWLFTSENKKKFRLPEQVDPDEFWATRIHLGDHLIWSEDGVAGFAV